MIEMYPLQGSGELEKTTGTTISACLIVKDEEEMLPRCLDSIKDLVNEIVIVDTGSTDRTIEIAESYQAEIHEYQWTDDFSAARNVAIERSNYEWVLIIDADEELDADSANNIRQWITEIGRDYDGIAFHILNETPSGWGKMQSPRLFKREAVHYEGIIHNLPIVDSEVVLSDLIIRHYGYNRSPQIMEVKYARSERLLLKAIAETPTARLYQHLIRLYRVTEKHVELSLAVDEYKAQFGDAEGEMAEVKNQMVSVDLIYSMIMQERYDEAVEEGIALLNKHPRNVDACYYMGMAFMSRGEFFKGATYFGLYLAWIERMKAIAVPTAIIVDTWGAVARAHFHIAECHRRRGQLRQAHEEYYIAYVMEPCLMYHEAMGQNMNKIELFRM